MLGLLIDREGGLPVPLPFTLISPGLMSMAWISQLAHQLVPCPAHAAILGLGLFLYLGSFYAICLGCSLEERLLPEDLQSKNCGCWMGQRNPPVWDVMF